MITMQQITVFAAILVAPHVAAARTPGKLDAAECQALPQQTETRRLLPGVAVIEDIDHGVRIRFAPGVNVAAVLERLQCYFAPAPGVTARAGPSRSIDLVATDATTVRAIRAHMRLDTRVNQII